MHDRIRLLLRQYLLDQLPIYQIAFDEFSSRIERATMTFAQVIENRDAVALVEQ